MERRQLWCVPPLRRTINVVVCLHTTAGVPFCTRMPCPKEGLWLQPRSWSKDMCEQGYGWPNSSCFVCLRNKLSWWETTEIWGSSITAEELITTQADFLPQPPPPYPIALPGASPPAFEPWAASLGMQSATSLHGCFPERWWHQLGLIIP